MGDQKLKCILHVGQNLKEPVKQFDSDCWQQIQKAAKLRLNKHTSSKYHEICEHLRTVDAIELCYGYHTTRYKNFTAISKEIDEANINPSYLQVRSNLPGIPSSSSGVFENVCIFCKAVSKRVGKNRETLGRCESFEAERNIKSAAKTLHDEKLLAQISEIDFISKEVKYHHSCRRLYLKRAENSSTNHESSVDKSHNSMFSRQENAHEKAFRTLSLYIEDEIIAKNGAEYLTSLHEQYVTLLECESKYSAQKVEAKILKKYQNEIKSTKFSNRKGKIIFSSSLSEEDAVVYANAHATSSSARIVDAAYILRREIFRLRDESEELPLPLSAEVLARGNGQPSCDLMRFFRTLYTGSPRPRDPPSVKAERCVRSSADDVLYNTTNGTLKPGKYLTLALGLKSITGSRKVIEILNHVGYHMVEMLETEMATIVSQNDSPLPDGLLQTPGLHTDIAWDNYDENTETLSGAGTLHDTVGICYQDIPTNPIITENEVVNTVDRFVCMMYNKGDHSDVNKVRFCIFEDKYAPPSKSRPLHKVKGCDPCAFPPSKSVLLQKLHRVHYVSSIWKKAHTARPATRTPETHGWRLVDGSYSVIWYRGDQMPSSVHRKLDTFSSDDSDEDEYSSTSDGDTDHESSESDIECMT